MSTRITLELRSLRGIRVKMPEQLPPSHDLREKISNDLEHEPILVPEFGVELRFASSEYAEPVAALYKGEFERGDYFASRYEDPDKQIFNPDWLARHEFQDPEHLRFVFTDSEGRLLGTTGFFHDRDATDGTRLMTSDATQIAPAGRGEHIMGHFFRRIVPLIIDNGAGIITDFVLTPESMSLRRTLQTEELDEQYRLISTGIHPHALRHRALGITRSEISAAKYPSIVPKPVHILPEFEPLYRIVQSQLPILLEPDIISATPTTRPTQSVEDVEVVRTVDATDPQAQLEAVESGWQPVEFDPDSNLFKVAQFPGERPDLDFILTSEHVPANRLLVRYLIDILYGSNLPDNSKGDNHG
jgi:hypothetical protein